MNYNSNKLPINVFLFLNDVRFKKFIDVILDKQRVSKNAHDLNNRATDLIIMFNDINETVRDDSDMGLDTDGIFAFDPKDLTLRWCLVHLKNSPDLPSVFIKVCNFM